MRKWVNDLVFLAGYESTLKVCEIEAHSEIQNKRLGFCADFDQSYNCGKMPQKRKLLDEST